MLIEGTGSRAKGMGSLGSDLQCRDFSIDLMILGDFNLSGEVRFTVLVCSEDALGPYP